MTLCRTLARRLSLRPAAVLLLAPSDRIEALLWFTGASPDTRSRPTALSVPQPPTALKGCGRPCGAGPRLALGHDPCWSTAIQLVGDRGLAGHTKVVHRPRHCRGRRVVCRGLAPESAAGTGRHAHAGGIGILERPIRADRLVLRRHRRRRSVRAGDTGKCACGARVRGQLRSAAGEGSVPGAPARSVELVDLGTRSPLTSRAPAGPLPASTSAEPAARGAASHHRRGRARATARRLPGAARGRAAQHALGGVSE